MANVGHDMACGWAMALKRAWAFARMALAFSQIGLFTEQVRWPS
jgi:hypothetical protein